jgi:glutamate-1-semialdehyde 2,1-aminomutase
MNQSGQELWKKAKNIIPGGNQLLSKRSELFLPEAWPSYYRKASGCEVWDMDNVHYYDFAGMGISSCTLGYADKDVNAAVKQAIDYGSMSTLNSFEEVALAEKLLELHMWSEMVRFARTGGEACSIAIRIARAASGHDGIAFCGYHGWHDWYLSANLSDEANLSSQLLPGLSTRGVPKALKNTTHPFNYNDIDSFKKAVASDDVGVIIMEPQRGVEPNILFLKEIREFATQKNIVLIFDEVTAGFHNNLGGLHLQLGVLPDIAIFAKAIGNGIPIAAIIGKRNVMDVAQETFISSTMWTERIGFAAGLATIDKMQEKNVQSQLVKYGRMIKEGWMHIAESEKIDIKIKGLDSIPNFTFEYSNSLALTTYFTQEMLKRGYLARCGTATTYAYNSSIIKKYLNAVQDVFASIQAKQYQVEAFLDGPIKHSGFSRLTG